MEPTPGRVRLKIDRIKQDTTSAEEFRCTLSGLSGIDQVEVSAMTGSVLITYDPSALEVQNLHSAASTAPGSSSAPTSQVLEQNLQEAESRCLALSELLTKVNARVGPLEEALAEANARVGTMERALVDANDRIALLERTRAEANVRIGSLEEALADATGRVDPLKRTVTEAHDRIAQLENALAQANDQVAQLERAMADMNLQGSSPERSLVLERALADANARLEIMEKERGELWVTLKEYDREVERLRQEVTLRPQRGEETAGGTFQP